MFKQIYADFKINATENDGENDLLHIRVDQLQHLEVYKHKSMKCKTKTNHKQGRSRSMQI